jgi:DNA polymerase-3 subunit epsilon
MLDYDWDPKTEHLPRVSLVLDVETTGLDPASDHLLSLGWVPVVRGEVVLAEARELRVRPPDGVDVGASATVHRLTDDVVSDATPLADALPPLLEALHGRVLLAHHSTIEVEFLAAAARTTYGAGVAVTAVDTLALQHRLQADEHGEVAGSLRLDAARRTFGLPRYSAHDALTDAIAAAELFLAQVAELERRLGREVLLRDLSPRRSG